MFPRDECAISKIAVGRIVNYLIVFVLVDEGEMSRRDNKGRCIVIDESRLPRAQSRQGFGEASFLPQE